MHVYVVKATHVASQFSKEVTVQSISAMFRAVETAIAIEEIMHGRTIVLTKYECDNLANKARMEYSYQGAEVMFTVEATKVEIVSPSEPVDVPDEALPMADPVLQDLLKRMNVKPVDPKAD